MSIHSLETMELGKGGELDLVVQEVNNELHSFFGRLENEYEKSSGHFSVELLSSADFFRSVIESLLKKDQQVLLARSNRVIDLFPEELTSEYGKWILKSRRSIFKLINEALLGEKKELWLADEQLGEGGIGEVFSLLDFNNRDEERVIKLFKQGNSPAIDPYYISLLKWASHQSENLIPYYKYGGIQDEKGKRSAFQVLKKLSSAISFEELRVPDDLSVLPEDYKSIFYEKALQADTLFLTWFLQAMRGLKDLHEKNFLHLDVKLNNLLLSSKESGLKAYLTDYDTVVKMGQKMEVAAGTPFYVSPEMMMRKSLSPKTDVYSVGRALYLWFVKDGQFTDFGSDLNPLIRYIDSNNWQHDIDRLKVSSKLRGIIRKCTAFKPSGRPDLDGLIGTLDEVADAMR